MPDHCVLGNIPGGSECACCIEDCEFRGEREPTDEEIARDFEGVVDDE